MFSMCQANKCATQNTGVKSKCFHTMKAKKAKVKKIIIIKE